MRPIRRGYTLTELVVAASLALSVGLGGLLAVQLSTRTSRQATAAQEALHAATQMDKAIRNGASACRLVPGAPLLDENSGEARSCRLWATLLTSELPHARNGALPGGVQWFQRFDRDGFARGLVRVDTRYVKDGKEVLHHVQLTPLY